MPGWVAHFNHDPEPQIEFASIQTFKDHLRDLRRRRVAIDDEDLLSPARPDQVALSGALLELECADDNSDATRLIRFYANPRRLLRSRAVADALGRMDVPHGVDLLQRLAEDSCRQVVAAARRSMSALASATPRGSVMDAGP